MKLGCLQFVKRQREADKIIDLDSVESEFIISFPIVLSSGRQCSFKKSKDKTFPPWDCMRMCPSVPPHVTFAHFIRRDQAKSESRVFLEGSRVKSCASLVIDRFRPSSLAEEPRVFSRPINLSACVVLFAVPDWRKAVSGRSSSLQPKSLPKS